MALKGVNLHFETTIESIEKTEGGLLVTLTNGESLEVDTVLAATGRKPHLEGVGLDALGIALNPDGTVKVNDRFETSTPSILALGDVTGGPELTPVALAEAMHLVSQHFGEAPSKPMDYRNIATAVFCHPNIGTVGLSEEQARAILDLRLQRLTALGREEIAEELSLSEETVKRHLSNIYDKLGVFSRVELAVFAINHGLAADRRPS